MTSVMSVIKGLVIYLLPFYLILRYLKFAYGTDFFMIVGWWSKNWRLQENMGLVMVFSLLAILFAVMVTSDILHRAYLSVAGENHELVYLGNPTELSSHYVSPQGMSALPLETYSDHKYNRSFSPIYRTEMFKRGRGENSAGVRVSDLHIMHVISTFLLAVAVYIFLICMLHIVAYPVSKVAHGDVVEMASVENLDQFLRRWKLSKGKLLVMFFGALVVGMLFMARGPASSFGNRVIPLPVSVVAGAELSAVPVSVNIEKERYRNRRNDDRLEYRETGYINVTYRFSEGFEIPVYVTARYYNDDYPHLYKEVKNNIKQRRAMLVVVEEDLSIRPKQVD